MFPVWAPTLKWLCPLFPSVWVGPANLHHKSAGSECRLGAPLDSLSCVQGAVTEWGWTCAGHPHQPFLTSGTGHLVS